MDSKYKRQVNELNKLWHYMLIKGNYKDIENKYSKIKSLSTSELSIIRIISEKEDVIIKDVINALNIPKSTLTSIIDRLEKKSIIVRSISNKDRRSYKLQLTEEGKNIQKEHIKFEEDIYGRVMSSLDTYEEREEFLRLIRKIANNISK
ncbi:MarR family winged helix-turn-helix transcriptional regulator [Clostridium taeniosporum]|uniref:MarR family transcriptional regulator n=1 Tax=Clostridium taeniosporum TaxID=394958 RepID=A0A1D7XMA2_9CLOT|nr:MarR family transcriptional regulator [Clostridium taeniosporum]AOR24456.1 MarR family transcriptional regulator [Clostridium taeniosporum]